MVKLDLSVGTTLISCIKVLTKIVKKKCVCVCGGGEGLADLGVLLVY